MDFIKMIAIFQGVGCYLNGSILIPSNPPASNPPFNFKTKGQNIAMPILDQFTTKFWQC